MLTTKMRLGVASWELRRLVSEGMHGLNNTPAPHPLPTCTMMHRDTWYLPWVVTYHHAPKKLGTVMCHFLGQPSHTDRTEGTIAVCMARVVGHKQLATTLTAVYIHLNLPPPIRTESDICPPPMYHGGEHLCPTTSSTGHLLVPEAPDMPTGVEGDRRAFEGEETVRFFVVGDIGVTLRESLA